MLTDREAGQAGWLVSQNTAAGIASAAFLLNAAIESNLERLLLEQFAIDLAAIILWE